MLRFLFTGLWLILGALNALAGGEPRVIPADEAAGFSHPYVLVVPANDARGDGTTVVVETNNTGASDDLEATLARTLEDAAGRGLGPQLSRHLGLPLVMPIFPRPRSDWKIYTHALDRDTMEVESGPLKRLDLQLLAMVEDARRRLQEEGYSVDEKFVLCGFSASGSFANRMAFLHPDRLKAVVCGGINAFPMLPVDELEGEPMRFPLGVADLEVIAGNPFNLEIWRHLPQMIFMGALDDNDAVKFDDAYSAEERRLIFEHLGEDMHARWMKAQLLCLKPEPQIKFVTYGQVGHWTDRQIGLDILNFVGEAVGRRD